MLSYASMQNEVYENAVSSQNKTHPFQPSLFQELKYSRSSSIDYERY
jgi:hypothetical protein